MKYLINLSFLLLSSFCLSQQIVNGTVYDEFGNPIPGVNITVKSKPIGITTDFDGNYRIDNIDPGKYTLLVSYIGYKSQEIELYISEFEITDDGEDTESSFSSKLGIDDEDEEEETDEEVPGILKAPFHENINFSLVEDALETEQVVVSASKKKEKLMNIAGLLSQSVLTISLKSFLILNGLHILILIQ